MRSLVRGKPIKGAYNYQYLNISKCQFHFTNQCLRDEVYIVKLMLLKIAFTQFFLIALAYSLCVNPSQSEGQCTECGPLDILIEGTCYVKIRGCLKHQAGPICMECQFGYVLNRASCIRDAIFYNNTNITNIPPVKINEVILTYDEIRNRLGQKYGNYFSDAHQFFLSKYAELGKGNVKSVDKMETKKGAFIVIEYSGDSLNKFLAVAFVDNSTNLIKQWSFEIQGNIKKDPITTDASIRVALGDRLKNYQIFDFRQVGDTFTIDYMGQNNDVIRVTLNRIDIGTASFGSKIVTKAISFGDLAVQQFLNIYPQYKNISTPSTLVKYDGLYVINFGNPSIFSAVSFQFNNAKFQFNKPYDTPSLNSNSDILSYGNFTGILVGGFALYTSYTQQKFISSVQGAAKEFPELIGAQVLKVQSQIVAGTNFLINLQKTVGTTVDNYDVRVWYTLQQIPLLFEVKKNGVLLYSRYYNYNVDVDFLNNYKIVGASSKVINVPPIQTVLYKQTGNRKYYKVSYSNLEFSQFEYFTNSSKANLLSYTVDGQNLLVSLSGAQQVAAQRSPDVLLSFLRSKQFISSLAKVYSMDVTLPTYTLEVVSSSGTFKVVIDDNGGELNVTQFLQSSTSTCYNMPSNEVQNSDKISTIDSFLKTSYPLIDFSLQSVQINVQSLSIVYRMLYASSKLKQIQIFVEQVENTANVIRASFINFGYEVVDPLPTNADFAKITAIMRNSTLSGTRIPFFTQVNGSMIKAYYDDGKSTSEIYYDKILNKATALVVSTRPYLLVPDGFNLTTLVYPGNLNSTLNATLNKIYQEALKKFTIVFKDAVLVFASKQANNYTLLYKNAFGYQKVDASLDLLGNVTFGRLIITAYKEGDFSNCQLFNLDGKCLSCNTETEVQYQGHCWKKIDGCLIQPGGICAKCNINYVKSAQRCYQHCSLFFI